MCSSDTKPHPTSPTLIRPMRLTPWFGRHYSAIEGHGYSRETRTTPALIMPSARGRDGEIDDAAANEGTAIIDAALDRAGAIGHSQHAAERARAVSAGQLAAFTGFSIAVVRGKPAFGAGNGND